MSESPAEPIRLVLVDDHLLVREGMQGMLASHDELKIVGMAATGEEAREVLAGVECDVILLDINLRGESGLDLCRKLLEDDPDLVIVCLTVHEEEHYLFEALRAGARGFLLKRVTPTSLLTAMRGVLDGETVVDPILSGKVTKIVAASEEKGLFWPGVQYGVTRREYEVLQLASEGFSNREMAERLFVSEETIKSHLKSLYRKLSVSDRTEAVSLALREGLVR